MMPWLSTEASIIYISSNMNDEFQMDFACDHQENGNQLIVSAAIRGWAHPPTAGLFRKNYSVDFSLLFSCRRIPLMIFQIEALGLSVCHRGWCANAVLGFPGKSSAGWLIELWGLCFVADWCFDKWRKERAVVWRQQLCAQAGRSGRGTVYLVI